MSLPVILWDVDDVLNRLTEIWFDTSARKFNPPFAYGALTQNPPHELLKISKRDYLDSLDDCREHFLYREPPRPEVMTFFHTSGQLFRHVALSAVPAVFMGRSAEWIFRYFGAWIQTVCFIPSARENFPVASMSFDSKSEAAASFGGILVDDSPANVADVLNNGGNALLFPAPWNSARDLPVFQLLNSLMQKEGQRL